MSTNAGAFLELKRFLTGVESTSQKLKANITDGKSSKSFVGIEGDNFVHSLEEKVLSVQSRLDSIESTVCGTVETRLSQVTMLEILQKCKALHHSNESMISVVEKRMSKYGYTAPIKCECIDEVDSLTVQKNLTLANQKPTREIKSAIIECDQSVYYDDHKKAPLIKNNSEEHAAHLGGFNNANNLDITANQNIIYENSLYDSPQNTEASDREVITPILHDWKLSGVTRMLVLNKDGKGDLNDTSTMNKSRLTQPYLYASDKDNKSTPIEVNYDSDGNTPKTPNNMNLSCASVSQSFVASSSNRLFSTTELEMLTPQPIHTFKPTFQNDDSPITPRLDTPFHTTRLLESAVTAISYSPESPTRDEVKLARSLELSPCPITSNKIAITEEKISSMNINSLPTTPASSSSSRKTPQSDADIRAKSFEFSPNENDNSIFDPSDVELFSPPKMAILAPGNRSANDLSVKTRCPPLPSVSVIPLVTMEEWGTTPSFLRKQTTTESLNTAIGNINKIIAERDLNGRGISSLSLYDMEQIVTVKAVILGLVNLKRLDIGSEDGLKVYKIRKL